MRDRATGFGGEGVRGRAENRVAVARSGGGRRTGSRGFAAGIGAGLFALAALAMDAALAAQLARVSPEGQVSRVRQVALRFDQPMVPLGDLRAAAPAAVQCSGAAPAELRGEGRWVDDRNWVFDFAHDLPPGVSCTIRLQSGLKSQAGQAYRGKPEYRFQTGGPIVVSSRPGGGEIEEDQIFALRFNGPATPASLRDHAWCQAQGLGERIPVRLVTGADRDAVLAALRWKPRGPDTIHLLACQQRLPAGAKMQLILEPGIATPSGIASREGRRFDYQVRAPFTASFSCERENAQAPCTPLRPITLEFSAPIARRAAESVVLRTPTGPVAPKLEANLAADATVTSLRFEPPFAENATMTLELPSGLKDETGRALGNADLFPLAIATAPMPPLAKFAAAPFGVIERFGEVPKSGKPADKPTDYPPLLPVTLRHVERELKVLGVRAEAGTVSRVRVDDDAAVLRWLALVRRMHETSWTRAELDAILAGKPPSAARIPRNAPQVQTRAVSLLAGVPGVRQLAVPASVGEGASRPFEVVGIPLPEAGFHVVEIASPNLGAALLGKPAPMYVRTAALVTNLGVHFKAGRDNAMAWVTTLDGGQPVREANVAVRDCSGKLIASGRTDAAGIARFGRLGDGREDSGGDGGSGAGRYCEDTGLSGYFVSARIVAAHPQARGQADMAFVMSDWNRGIESWRFHVPTDTSPTPTLRAHTVFDRTLLSAGETVSMKHYLRVETANGLALPPGPDALPDKLVIRHEGSGQTYEQPLQWRTTASGGRSADSRFALPPAARLGRYTVELADARQRSYDSGAFRVEAFRLPVLTGTVRAATAGGAQALVAPKSLPLDVEVHYVSGGAAAGLPVRVSALLRERMPRFADADGYSFAAPRAADEQRDESDEGEDQNQDQDRAAAPDGQTLIADKRALTLDANGGGRLTLDTLPAVTAPRDLLVEAAFADPNGEIQTLRQTLPLWPAAVVAGIRADDWVAVKRQATVQGIALDIDGKPRAGVPMEVHARARITTSARKRVVGGFYRYDNRTEVRDLGKVCEAKTDARGRMRCAVTLEQAGEVELIARARDDAGRISEAATSVWVTGQGELWFGGENHDRIDLLPERPSYAPGDTARFQVRMPFRQATALVAVEREGILETSVVTLAGKDPTVSVKIKPEWGPNVYVSVLALRGRLHEVPWYSFFTWGWREPREWWRAFRSEGREYVAPTPLVDLSKPAFRLGVAEIRVGNEAHRLDVKVATDRASYPVRGQAKVTVHVTLPDGKPAANGEVALAAVDEALLELMPNTSWNLLEAMLQRRSYGVETATAQMEIVGRRHYGRKAVPAGGGGGRNPTRELFDTLLLWNPRVQLDAAGKAALTVPLNDSLTRFRIVAIADLGVARFGTGSATVAATQDLQLISGLPPLVREGDRYRAMFTLRNTTARAMTVEVSARSVPAGTAAAAAAAASAAQSETAALPTQTVSVLAGQAREIGWDVVAPPIAQASGQATATESELQWEIAATETNKGDGKGEAAGPAADRIRIAQRLAAAVPLTVQQGTLAQLAPSLSVPVRAPAAALRDPSGAPRGGLRIGLQSSLAGGLPGVRDWFTRYPYTCLEQRASKAVGLGDGALWQALMAQLPAYQDDDGLVAYFPMQGEAARDGGSEVLTAYLLALADEANRAGLPLPLPAQARERMEQALTAFVEGRLQRRPWAPTADLEVRKLAALEALSRSGKAQARMLGSIQIAPQQWPTSALLDWTALLQRLPDVPQREARLAEAQRLLRARLDLQGTRLAFSTERDDHWWWLMAGGDINAARLLTLALELPDWRQDAPRLASGLLGRQTAGAWSTTNANAWGVLAVRRFAQAFEREPVGGATRVTLGDASRSFEWRTAAAGKDGVAAGGLILPWPSLPAQSNPSGAPATLQLQHEGAGRPWATVRALAAVPLAEPIAAGYRIRRSVSAVEQATPGRWSRGDIYRVRLEIDAQTDMTWVVVSDPVPAGAAILGSGLGRDSQIATRGERRTGAWPAFSERTPQAYREYYAHLPKGTATVEYTVRLNNAGEFALPPTRVEAMYAPEVFGAAPNARLTVGPRP
ncbi:alpha-2-macroglobulin [Cupriavidus gilardii]|nr:alpha-2-macroglobulin [Cupriavidus gilardii]